MKELSFADSWYWFLLMAVACYFIGCFNFAVVIAKARHADVRKIGSGNPGTMNISREYGLRVGFMNFLLDSLKGGIPALVSYFIFRRYLFAGTQVAVSDFTRYWCGLFVIVGHIYPVTMHFRGGKGIASTLGLFWICLACENPWYLLIGFGGLLSVLAVIAVTEWGSLGSLYGVTGFTLWQGIEFYLKPGFADVNVWVVVISLILLMLNFLTWFAHRKNLVRLFVGEEHRTSVKKLSKGKRGKQNM